MGNVKRGDIVIINDWDKPTAELLAVVTKIDDDGVAQALYITTYPRLSSCAGRNTIKIEDFGQQVEFHQDGGQIRTVTVGASAAKYEDGSPRSWQDYQPEKWWECRLSVGALKALGVEVTPSIPTMMGCYLGAGDHTVVYHGKTDPTWDAAGKIVELENRITKAIDIAFQYGSNDGSHHKMWTIDQMLRVLSGDKYDELISEFWDGEDGPYSHTWSTGLKP